MACLQVQYQDRVVTDANWFKDYCENIRAGSKIVLVPGCFDLLHIGHIRHLEQAKKFGDMLVVVVTVDEYAAKGPGRPAFNQAKRMECLAALSCVDWVIPSQLFGDGDSGVNYLRAIKPKYYVRGKEYQASSASSAEVKACRDCGGQDVYTDIGNIASSSQLVNDHFSTVPDDAVKWLKEYKAKFNRVSAAWNAYHNDYFCRAEKLKVLVVGEYIQDEYVWVKTLGKSGKEPILAAEEISREKHNGGSSAVVGHLLSFVGSNNVSQWADGECLTKTRFVEIYPEQKIGLELYRREGNPISRISDFGHAAAAVDIIMIVDYGHGMMDDGFVHSLCECGKYLALNVQANAGNFGFNTINKYSRADYLCISERELRLAYHQLNGYLGDLVLKASERMGFHAATITQGREGVLCWVKDQGFSHVPALTDHFRDRVGAGDAVLAVTSLLAYQNAPPDVLGLVANAVGSLAVKIVGNREPVNKDQLLRYLKGLLA